MLFFFFRYLCRVSFFGSASFKGYTICHAFVDVFAEDMGEGLGYVQVRVEVFDIQFAVFLMNYDTIAVILTVIAGWWAIHGDIAQLRERMAKLEGTMEVLKDLLQASVANKTPS